MTTPQTGKPLPQTLAHRVQYFRESRQMSRELLAEKAQLALEFLTDIESGLEMFLAPSVRLKLARALQVSPEQLREVERNPFGRQEISRELQNKCLALMEDIRRNPDEDYTCPVCQHDLAIRQFERRDLEDNPLMALKVHCTHCLFRLILD